MKQDPLLTTLLDLDVELAGKIELMIVGLLTKDEDAHARGLALRFADHSAVVAARGIAATRFIDPAGIGRVRILEHQLATPAMDLDRFSSELRGLLVPRS